MEAMVGDAVASGWSLYGACFTIVLLTISVSIQLDLLDKATQQVGWVLHTRQEEGSRLSKDSLSKIVVYLPLRFVLTTGTSCVRICRTANGESHRLAGTSSTFPT